MTVVVVSTGGTIAMRPDPATGKLVPAVSGDELVEMLEWHEAPALQLDDFARIPSFDMHGRLAVALAERVLEHATRTDVAGIVVTHGTDTMEETAYVIDLLHDGDTPVVLTGAQRGADERDADGPRNLRDAITVAASEAGRGRGTLIAMAGEIHAARTARKVHTSALGAFGSPGYGPVGHVDDGLVTFRARPERRPALPLPTRHPRVDLLRLHAGSDAVFVRASLAAGAEAIVLEGTGRGNANETVLEAVREAIARGVPVVICSRCTAGAVAPVYGRGGGRDLAEAGALFAGDLAGPKVRVLLELALGSGLDPAEALGLHAGV